MRRKGQSDVVSFLIITLIILVVVSGTFFWAKSMVERNNNYNDVTRMENRMREINEGIIDVANEQGQRSIDVEIKSGNIFLESNTTLTYSTDLDLPEAKFSGNSVIIGNNSATGPCLGSDYGMLGTDESGCMIESGALNIKLKYIILNETSTSNCYNILLESGGSAAIREGVHNILIKYVRTDVGTSTGCTQLITKVVSLDME